ncbi:hypothetical protein [Kineococcus terrestris]|uniref:hypothetical protein n=1 Tax=Kineococcus terrestris TaxID=2044856 RepID=UPI0034DAF06D
MQRTGADGAFAYVLMSHVDADLVLRTARRVRELSPGAHVLVRHSRPGFLDPREAAAAGAQVLRSRTAIRWGTWSTVAAVLEALAEAERRFSPSHTVLLSGQDHPVRDLAAWERSLTGVDALLNPDPREHRDRWERSWHRLPGGRLLPARLAGPVAAASRGVGGLVPGAPDVRLAGGRTWLVSRPRADAPPVPYRKGSLWTVLSRRAVARLLRTTHERPDVVRFFASTLLPDEAYVHSVLAAHPDLRVVHGPTTLALFAERAPHPGVLHLEDLPLARASGAAFARKVVRDVSDAFVVAADAAVDADRAGTGTTSPA